MSYQGRDGRQYVVVVAGGHGTLGTTPGDDVIAYALAQGGLRRPRAGDQGCATRPCPYVAPLPFPRHRAP